MENYATYILELNLIMKWSDYLGKDIIYNVAWSLSLIQSILCLPP